MCEVCGCVGTTPRAAEEVRVLQSLLQQNDHQATHNREHFDRAGVFVVNLMSSPGAGKTSLLEATIKALSGRLSVVVIEGDLATENDARRIREAGAPAIQITTGNACHLDAAMIHGALHQLDLGPIDILFIENVGNLVCPAAFDLGQHRNIVLLSVTEGDDKPEKYPVMFRAADLMVVTKMDLLQAVGDFDPIRAKHHLRNLANAADVIELSSRNGDGMAHWIDWLIREAGAHAQHPPAAHPHTHPAHLSHV